MTWHYWINQVKLCIKFLFSVKTCRHYLQNSSRCFTQSCPVISLGFLRCGVDLNLFDILVNTDSDIKYLYKTGIHWYFVLLMLFLVCIGFVMVEAIKNVGVNDFYHGKRNRYWNANGNCGCIHLLVNK